MNVSATTRTLLGFDFGRSRIGVAVGQELTGSARPLATLPCPRQQPDWPAIAALLEEWRPQLLVVGVPRHADGSANAVTEAALRFSRQLQGRFRLPVAIIDERLSSHAAQERIAESSLKRRRRRDPALLDSTAAALILESWFNHHRTSS
ncbi:MAG TPA: Holliday junction resolvase RuvX [Candidatus Competibacteraceae bacterium]|nr:Holliday junction resolvase RuvX [Candidatus Competibacteraceae bacterium]